MSLDKRYPAFLLIAAVFLGLFLFRSSSPKKEPLAAGPLASVPGALGAPLQPKAQTSLPVFPIDLNRASVSDLALLPGIGEKTARRIVEKRAELGGYRSVEELTEVKWVGRAKLERIRGLVTVGPKADEAAAPR